jgi:phage tail-like protein
MASTMGEPEGAMDRKTGEVVGRWMHLVSAASLSLFCGLASGAQPVPEQALTVRLDAGNVSAFFVEVSGLGSESEIELKSSASSDGQIYTRKLPGRIKWPEITLRRLVSADRSLAEWRGLVEKGNVQAAMRKFTITIFDSTMRPVMRWEGANGWPAALELITLERQPPVHNVEELTIAHEGIVRTL